MRTWTSLAAVMVLLAACGGSDAVGPEPGPVAALAVIAGNAQEGQVGVELPTPIVVKVADAQGRAVSGQIINFVVVTGSGSVFAGAAQTNANGEARERWTLGTKTGVQALEARAVDQETGDPITFARIEATAIPGPADTIILSEHYTQFVGRAIDLSGAVDVQDAYGNTIEGAAVTVKPGPTVVADGLVLTASAETLDTVAVQVGEARSTIKVAFLRDLSPTRWRLTATCRGRTDSQLPDSVAYDAITDSVTVGVGAGPGHLNGTVSFWFSGAKTTIWWPGNVVQSAAPLGFQSVRYLGSRALLWAVQLPGKLDPGGEGLMLSDGLASPTYQGGNICQTEWFTGFDPALLQPIP